jgi:hypothetical protein
MPGRTAARGASAPRENKHGHRRQPRQMELFESEAAGSPIGAPTWPELPSETRRTLTELMARLLLEHGDRNRAHCVAEVGHDG